MTADKTHLLVTGTARSGTTALAELLNAHHQVCIGIERFKFQYLRSNNYSDELLERDRFFDFREEDTNLRPAVRPHWQGVYDQISEKWDRAKVIGDKVPDMSPVLEDYMAANPRFKCIYILRNLKDVGLSWQARADRTRDAWPKGKGFILACEEWEKQTRTVHDIVASGHLRARMLILDYDAIYAEDSRVLPAIMGFLGLDASAAFTETFARHVEFASERRSRRVPPKFVDRYREVEMGHARGLRKHARSQMHQWADVFEEKI
ncbi:sulfotransferase [Rhodobacteraceae bacterium R_SAG9]|nr:sulfotransferase [Rhodobacteraceae bacterium R_SAG9]